MVALGSFLSNSSFVAALGNISKPILLLKGDLIVETELLFPVSFSNEQKMLLKAAFFLPPKLLPEQTQAIKGFEAAFKHTVKGWETGFPRFQDSCD